MSQSTVRLVAIVAISALILSIAATVISSAL